MANIAELVGRIDRLEDELEFKNHKIAFYEKQLSDLNKRYSDLFCELLELKMNYTYMETLVDRLEKTNNRGL